MSENIQDAAAARERMVDLQIARRGIRDPAVLAAMRSVSREVFVDPDYQSLAYEDRPLPIGERQTISQPYIVALMIEAAALQPTDRVLEVGAGSGYAAAVMSRIADRVEAIERHPSLAAAARLRLRQLGCDNVQVHVADGMLGLPGAAPFDAIIVSAGGVEIPPALKEQLAIGGRLVIPIGAASGYQRLLKVVRRSETRYDQSSLGDVRFVPLVSGPPPL